MQQYHSEGAQGRDELRLSTRSQISRKEPFSAQKDFFFSKQISSLSQVTIAGAMRSNGITLATDTENKEAGRRMGIVPVAARGYYITSVIT